MSPRALPPSAIYCDNETEGRWFVKLDSRLEDVPLVVLRNRSLNADPRIEELLTYDRPDIILVLDGEPRLVVEKTREVPTGHNVGQRMARLVRAVELGVPTIKFFPFEAMKHGKFAGRCFLNARILHAMERITEIHGVPLLAVDWPCDTYFELIDDGSEDARMRLLVSSYLDEGLAPACRGFSEQVALMDLEYRERTARDPSYAKPPPSVSVVKTRAFVTIAGAHIGAQDRRRLLERDETVVYRIGMTPGSCRREDPYTGTQFIYDYSFCRDGVNPADKYRNLVLQFPKLTRERFVTANPNDPGRKSSNWYLTASALMFSDGFLPLHL